MRRIDPETWQRLAPLLDKVLDQPEEERAAFIEKSLGHEPELRDLLGELVEAEGRAAGVLETPVQGLATSLPGGTPEPVQAPPRVEGYDELEEVGRGGMGVVYRAIRRGEGFEQQLAVKVLRPGLDETGVRHRFERERAILARLEHPNIVRLVDGGTTLDGRSYFAMEYVSGVPITRFADEQRLTLEQRSRLFEDVCAAVSFAQQRLVVHRDLKPSNILVDTEGRVRLLDFGIARLLDPEGTAAAGELTRDGSRVLTPEYAAPEQLRGEPSSTATDVYALGVILFELLSGRHPHGETRAGGLEIAMGIRESQPLSQAVESDQRVLRADGTIETITAEQVARARRLSPRSLQRALGGDLATICAKALQPDPALRYPSAEALLADMVRERSGHPLEARAPSWRYRASKYLRRHRTPVAAGLVVLLALGTGLGVSVWQARQAAREADRAGRAYEFLSQLFDDAHPNADQGADWSAAQLLERGASRLANAWPDDVEARNQLQQNIARILTERGNYDIAASTLREALGRDDTVEINELRLALARVELYRNRTEAADSLLAVIDQSADPLGPGERTRYLESAASIRYGQGSYAEAESLTRVIMEITIAEHGVESPEYGMDLNNLGAYQSAQARYEQSEATYREALRIFESCRPRPLTNIALAHHNLGDLYQVSGRHEEAITEYEEAVRIRRRLHPDGHYRLAGSLRGLANEHQNLGNLEPADSLLTEAADMILASAGPNDREYANALNTLAILAYRRQDLDEARERFIRANSIFESVLGPTHPSTLTVTNNLATIQSMSGHAEEAEATFRTVLERRREALGDEHPDVAFSHNSIGSVLVKLDRPEEAVEQHREALRILLAIHGEANLSVASTRSQLGTALRAAGEIEESLQQIQIALEYREANLPANHRDVTDSRMELGYGLIEAERWDEARQTFLTAEREIETARGPEAIWLASARAGRGLCLARLGQVEEGRRLNDSACDLLIREYGTDDWRTRRALGYQQRIGGG